MRYLYILFILLVSLNSYAVDLQNASENSYSSALYKLQNHKYSKARNEFKDIVMKYPFSELALKSEIILAYIDFRNRNYNEAIAALESYLRYYTYNTSKTNLNYIYYLLGLSYFYNIKNNLMDLNYIYEAHDMLSNFSNKVHNPEYKEILTSKLQITQAMISEKVFNIGKFYFDNHNLPAAINRFDSILLNEDFINTEYYCRAFNMLMKINDIEHGNFDMNKYEVASQQCYDNSKNLLLLTEELHNFDLMDDNQDAQFEFNEE